MPVDNLRTMSSSRSYALSGLVFLGIAALLLTSLQPVWWSVLSLVVVAGAAIACFVRAALEARGKQADGTSERV